MVLETEWGLALINQYGRNQVREEVRHTLARLRDGLLTGQVNLSMAALLSRLEEQLQSLGPRPLVAVFNLTGTVLHTNLGRAPLAETALEAIRTVAGACNLEYDLDQGKRDQRDRPVEKLVCDLTGAEAALLVNNNAAAVLLCLNTLALNRQVPVSRGELVEIGGSFRVPDIMQRAGCSLVEVGTTNRTHLADFAAALGRETGAVMQVHTSNYRIQGFTLAVATGELSALCRKHGLPLINDLGSGTLIDLQRFGLPGEPTVSSVLEAGADLVTFSGDKLLGGPQAGIVAGRRELVQRLRRNPLQRALRVDKLTLAALLATLKLFQQPDRLQQQLPTLRLLCRSRRTIHNTAQRISNVMANQLTAFKVEVTDCWSQIGSGALPVGQLPSSAVAVSLPEGGQKALLQLQQGLRNLPRPVIGRLHQGRLLLDMRCLEATDEAAFLAQLPRLELQNDRRPGQESQ